jgi:hypothetical protein
MTVMGKWLPSLLVKSAPGIAPLLFAAAGLVFLFHARLAVGQDIESLSPDDQVAYLVLAEELPDAVTMVGPGDEIAITVCKQDGECTGPSAALMQALSLLPSVGKHRIVAGDGDKPSIFVEPHGDQYMAGFSCGQIGDCGSGHFYSVRRLPSPATVVRESSWIS